MTLNDTFRIEDLAKVYQNILGNSYYSIDVYSNLKVDGNIIQGIIKPYRRPFKLSNIKAETVELILEFYISVRKNKEKLDEFSDLAKICGLKKGTFTSNNKTYTYHSFLDFASPANAPVADFGDYTQVVILNGTCLVSEASGGAMVSNELKTEFIIEAPLPRADSGIISTTVTSFPAFEYSNAASSPVNPPPAMITFFPSLFLSASPTHTILSVPVAVKFGMIGVLPTAIIIASGFSAITNSGVASVFILISIFSSLEIVLIDQSR